MNIRGEANLNIWYVIDSGSNECSANLTANRFGIDLNVATPSTV